MSQDATALLNEIAALNQQLVGMSEHRSRLMVLLTERAGEIADLTVELTRVRTEGLRHLEDAQAATRQLRRANEKLVEVAQAKQTLELGHSQLHDELERIRWELATSTASATKAQQELSAARTELGKLRQSLDAASRTLEAEAAAWQEEREQLEMTVSGLSLEIRSEHQAARILERRWTIEGSRPLHASSIEGHSDAREPIPFDYRLARAEALEEEVSHLRDECALLSAKLRELERDAGATAELGRVQQDLRSLQVDRQLLERKLEDAQARDGERLELQQRVEELTQRVHETDSLQAEVERLRAKLYKAPVHSGTFPVHGGIDATDRAPQDPRDLGQELTCLASRSDAWNAVIADDLGFTVASVGSALECDSLAAVAGAAERLSSQATQTLGIAEVTQLTLEDRHGKVAHFRYFIVEDSVMSIGTLGSRPPEQEDLDRVVGTTREALSLSRAPAEPVVLRGHRASGRIAAGRGGVESGALRQTYATRRAERK